MIKFRQKEFIAPIFAAIGRGLATAGKGIAKGVSSMGKAAVNTAKASNVAGGEGSKGFLGKAVDFMGGKAMTGVMVGSSIISGVQGHKSNKIQEKAANEQTSIANRELAMKKKALNQGINPWAGEQQPSQVAYSDNTSTYTFKRKTFANANNIVVKTLEKYGNKLAKSKAWKGFKNNKAVKEVHGFGKDLAKLGNTNRPGNKGTRFDDYKEMLGTGLGMAATGYGVNKLIELDARKNGIYTGPDKKELTEKDKKKKAVKRAVLAGAGTLGTLGGSLYLARKGNLNAGYLKKQAIALGNSGKAILKGAAKPGSLIFGGLFAAGPAISYLSNKKMMKDQIKNESERTYSIKDKAGKFLSNWFLVGYNKKGRAELQNQLNTLGKKSGNKITKFVAKHINPKNAVLGTAVGLGLGSLTYAPMGWGEKATRKTLTKLDKNAYAYEKSQEQQVN